MSLRIHFLDVGAGDCTIVHFPARTRHDGTRKSERIMMLDICHHDDHHRYENVIDYYKSHFRNDSGILKPIFRFVCTHPHHDHICGLSTLFDDDEISITNFWDLDHRFEPESLDYHPTHASDWTTYVDKRCSESAPKAIRTRREGTPRQYWGDSEDRISVLSPSDNLIQEAHYTEDGDPRDSEDVQIDEMSYALLIRVNSRKIVLAGDGRATPCWDDIYDTCQDQLEHCLVLKAAHHGQESGFHEDAVKLMDPSLVIFSNSKTEDTEHGGEELYQDAVIGTTVLKTCDDGTIIVEVPYSEDKPITYKTTS